MESTTLSVRFVAVRLPGPDRAFSEIIIYEMIWLILQMMIE